MSVTAQNFRNFIFALYNVQPTETLDQMLGALQNRYEPRITDAFINTLRANGYPNFGNLGGQGNWFPIPKDLVRTSASSLAFIGDARTTMYPNPLIIVFNRANGQFFSINDQRQVTPIPEDTSITIWGHNPDPDFGAEDMDVVPADMDAEPAAAPVAVPAVVPEQPSQRQVLQQQIIDTPDYLIDSVTTDFFEDPVIGSDGNTYQRATAREMIIRRSNTATGTRLNERQLYPNPLIKRAVDDFKQKYQQVQTDRYRRRAPFQADSPGYLLNPANGQLFENPVIDLAGPAAGRTRQSTPAQRQYFAANRKYPARVVSNTFLKKAIDDYKATRDRLAAAGGGV